MAITYWTEALLAAAVLPKCCAARTASAAICDCLGFDGAELALSAQTPVKIPVLLPACVPKVPQVTVPVATPWQYWVTLLSQELPPTPR